MSELGPDARFILDAARDGDEPGAVDQQRVRAALARRIGVGAAVVGASVASATTAKGAVVSTSSLFVKLAIFAGAVSLAASGGVLAVRYVKHARDRHESSETPVASAMRVSAPSSPPPAILPPSPLPESSTEVAVDEPAAIASASANPIPKTIAPLVAPSVASAASVASAKPDPLNDELPMLGAAMAALGENDANRALLILDEHAKKFPNGTLAEERNGARCIAYCMLGRGDARAQAESFLAKHPDAPLRARIEKACGLP